MDLYFQRHDGQAASDDFLWHPTDSAPKLDAFSGLVRPPFPWPWPFRTFPFVECLGALEMKWALRC